MVFINSIVLSKKGDIAGCSVNPGGQNEFEVFTKEGSSIISSSVSVDRHCLTDISLAGFGEQLFRLKCGKTIVKNGGGVSMYE